MNRKTKLFLFTNAFPCQSDLEQYIEHEIPYLSNAFEKIYIFPSTFGKVEIKIPANVEVIDFYDNSKISLKNFLTSLPFLLKLYLNELIHSKNKRYLLINFKLLIINLYNAYACSNGLVLFAKKNQINLKECQFYSYWFYHSAIILSIMKERKLIDGFISRGHLGDVYLQYLFKTRFQYLKTKNVSKLYLISEHAKEYMTRNFPRFKDKFEVAYLGVKDNMQNTMPKGKEFILVSCSKVDDRKRVHLIPEILSHIKFDIHWYHIGRVPVEEKRIYDFLKTKPNNVNVTLLGTIRNQLIHDFYKNNRVDAFINVSTEEGISFAIIEACSYGIPIIATDSNGTREIATNESGFLIPVDFKIEEVVKILNDLNSNVYPEKRNGARKLFNERFNSEKNFYDFIRQIQY
jgi:glycosyltransferase involved in cell wall biosynthesis